MHAIKLTGLTKRYGDKRAVDGLDFSVLTGATVGLLGGNGGNTAKIAMLLGLLTDHRVHQRAGR